jgi:amino acid adenylation domain-containing protein
MMPDSCHSPTADPGPTPAGEPADWNEADASAGVEERFAEQVRRLPRAIALECGEERLTYLELARRVNRLARQLRRSGVAPETLVGLCLERGPELVTALLAVLAAGGAYLPLDPTHPDPRLSYILEDSRAALLLSERRFAAAPWIGEVERLYVDSGTEDSPEEQESDPPPAAVPANLAYVLYTSGSTGRPKGVQVTRGALANFLRSMAREPGLAAADRLLAVTTPAFDIAALELFLPLTVGARVIVARREEMGDVAKLAALISRSAATVMQATPATWRLLLDSGWCPSRPLRILCGGEALPSDLAKRLLAHAESLWNLYGPTETTVWSCVERVRTAELRVSIGRPIRNTRVQLCDAEGNPVDAGVAGELCIAGEGLARGYLRRPDLTAERFVPCPFAGDSGGRLYRTGDLARRRPDGALEFLGRIDQQVKVRGFRIEPAEVEAELVRHPAIRSAVVVARDDRRGEKRLVAYYVAAAEQPVEELRTWLGRNLPAYMVPSAFVRLAALPLNTSGKVDRHALPAPGGARPLLEVPYAPPRGELEQRLTELWREVLGSDEVGVLDDFFAAGGDSMGGAKLLNRLQRELGEPLFVMALFEAPTPARLADYLRRHYSRSLARRFPGEVTVADEDEAEVGPAEIARMRGLLARRYGSGERAAVASPNPPAVFILSPPRSGSTLLRVMLGGHPRLFSPPELHLLSWESLDARAKALAGRDSFAAEGLLRAILELEGGELTAALERVREFEARGLTTQAVYRFLQERVGDRLLVDKTTTYGLEPTVLRRAERFFAGALYVHLVRNPQASIRSYVEARMDQVYGLPFRPRRQAELVWTISHENIAEFLAGVPAARQLRVRFEDLVREPAAAMRRICRLLGIEFAAEMLRPYEGRRMTDGLHAESRMMGDPRFAEHRAIDPAMAEKRDGEDDDLLSETTWRRAESLGYGRPVGARPAKRQLHLAGPVPAPRERDLPLSFAQERLWLLDRLLPGSAAYNVPMLLRLSGALDPPALRRALSELLRRHEVLRTTFPARHGQPIQVIASASELAALPWVDLEICPGGLEEMWRLVRQETRRCLDLERGPVWRALAMRVGQREHWLLLVVHHIACDGWSRGLIVRELDGLYDAFVAGRPSPFPQPPLQYADFALWQRVWLAGEALEAQLRYWRAALTDPTPFELPSDRPRPALPSFRGAERQLSLPASLASDLRALGRSRGATPFMVFLALFQALLHRYTGAVDLIVGTPIASRNRAELEELIGCLVNTLALRTDLSGEPPFLTLVDRVRETALAAYAHQDLPFERLVEELQPERDLGRNPFFQLVFALQGGAMPTVCSSGLTLQLVEIELGTAKFDLSLILAEDEGGLLARLEYSTELFEATTASRLLEHFRTLTTAAVAAPEQRLGALPVLAEAERHQLVREWNDTAAPGARDGCLHQAFEAQADRTPEAVAVAQGAERLTYGELELRANQLARRLRKLGVQPEVRVALCLERSTAAVVGLLAILKAGGVYVPLDPSHPAPRRAFQLRDSGAKVLLTRAVFLAAWPDLPSSPSFAVLDLGAAPEGAEGGERLDATATGVTPRHLAYLLYTSGSTGEPKAVGVEHRAAAQHVETMRRCYGLGPEDRVLQFSALSLDVSLEQILCALAAGACLVLRGEELWSPAELAAELCRAGITVADLPVSYLLQCVGEWSGGGSAALPQGLQLRAVSAGGEAMAPEIPGRWDALRPSLGPGEGPQLLNAYGPTEAVITAVLFQASPARGRRSATGVPLGYPLAGRATHVLDRHGHPAPAGVPGELWLGGPLARGYPGAPALTAERFVPDPWNAEPGARLYRTGDRARWRVDGTLEFLGRLDRQIKLRGLRIELGELEAVLRLHPRIAQALVEVRDAGTGQRLVAFVETKRPPVAADELRAFAGSRLPAFMVPADYVVLESFPLSANGKVDRRALLAITPEATRDDAWEGPRTPLEEVIAAVWGELLGQARVGVNDNFFALGGHSLKAIQMTSLLGQVLGCPLTTGLVFAAPTVGALSSALLATSTSAGRVEKAAALWRRLAGLSDDEVEAMVLAAEVPA